MAEMHLHSLLRSYQFRSSGVLLSHAIIEIVETKKEIIAIY